MAYTYLIGWSKLNKWYCGVRFSKKSETKDLWKTYFTSSNHVKKFRIENGEPDIIEIRKEFSCPDKARLWESNVLNRIRAAASDNWLNKVNANSKFYATNLNRKFSDDHKRKLSEAKIGKKISKEHALKLHEGRKNSKNSITHNEIISKIWLGRKHTEETKKKISLAKKGKTSPLKGVKNFRDYSYMKTERYKEIMRQSWIKRKEGLTNAG